jgi:hypothetical protein
MECHAKQEAPLKKIPKAMSLAFYGERRQNRPKGPKSNKLEG